MKQGDACTGEWAVGPVRGRLSNGVGRAGIHAELALKEHALARNTTQNDTRSIPATRRPAHLPRSTLIMPSTRAGIPYPTGYSAPHAALSGPRHNG